MNRLTKDDVKQMGMLELSHNQVFVKNREAWYRDFETEITARDLARAMFARNGIECPSDNEEFDEYMLELLQDGYETIDGMIALYYNALWAFAGVREKLKAYEDTGLEPEDILPSIKILSDEFNKIFEELKEYRNSEEQGILIKLPCKVGDTVYQIMYDRTIENYKVVGFEIDEREKLYVRVLIERPAATIKLSYRKEDLYFTKEEAEKALKERGDYY